MQYKDLTYVKAIRTFNKEEIYGHFIGWHSPTKKMQENNIYVGIVYSNEYQQCFDVYPESIEYLNANFNIYEFIS